MREIFMKIEEICEMRDKLKEFNSLKMKDGDTATVKFNAQQLKVVIEALDDYIIEALEV